MKEFDELNKKTYSLERTAIDTKENEAEVGKMPDFCYQTITMFNKLARNKTESFLREQQPPMMHTRRVKADQHVEFAIFIPPPSLEVKKTQKSGKIHLIQRRIAFDYV